MQGRRVVAVAGTHGKTTTTSLLTVALPALRRRPVVRDRRRAQRVRLQRPRRHRRPVRRRGRRERRRLPRLLAVRRAGHQRRGRPPRQLRHRGGLPRGVRRRSWTGSTRRASWSRASTTPAPPTSPSRPRHAGLTVVGVGESPTRADLRAERPDASRAPPPRFTVVDRGRRARRRWRCRSRAGTTSSTRWPRWPPGSGSASRSPTCGAGWRRSAAPGAGWSSRARRRRPGLRQLRPPPQRDRRRPAGRPLARRRRAGWWWPSSRTWSRAPGSSARDGGGARRRRRGGGDGRVRRPRGPRARRRRTAGRRRTCRCRRAGAVRAVVAADPGTRWWNGPGPATWCSPSAPVT